MFVGFNVIGTDLNFLKEYPYYGEGIKLFEDQKETVQESIDYYLLDDIIDAESLEEDWFPQIEANVFISHSHKDKDLAIGLAGFLNENFGIKSFIDSTVWGYSNDLLKEIDNKFCYNESRETYDYNKRNITTTHVHMMLNAALNKMINKTECVLFLNTPNSIELSEDNNITESPWIYSELIFSDFVQKNLPSRYCKDNLTELFHRDSFGLTVQYKIPIDNLITLNKDDIFELWEFHRTKNGLSALDALYKMKGILGDGK